MRWRRIAERVDSLDELRGKFLRLTLTLDLFRSAAVVWAELSSSPTQTLDLLSLHCCLVNWISMSAAVYTIQEQACGQWLSDRLITWKQSNLSHRSKKTLARHWNPVWSCAAALRSRGLLLLVSTCKKDFWFWSSLRSEFVKAFLTFSVKLVFSRFSWIKSNAVNLH